MAGENESSVDKSFVLDEISKFIQPYLAFDQGGKVIEGLTELAWGVYSTDLRNLSARDREQVLSPKLIKSAARQIMGFNESSEDPTINGHPVYPFKAKMTPEAMQGIWDSITEEDLLDMNEEGAPVDSIDKMEAEDVSLETIKAGWLVYVSPGIYYIGIPDRDEPEGMAYVMNADTKLFYVFDYKMKEQELDQRRI